MIGSVYDYYLTTYAGKLPGKYDTHKKSELRNIYNNIVKISKHSPLYKIDISEDVQKYAIDLKENARSLYESIDNLSLEDYHTAAKSFVPSDDSVLLVNTFENVQNNSSNSSTVEDENGFSNDDIEEFEFEIKQLATSQVNTGKYLSNNGKSFTKGEHFFELTVGDATYEFQFSVNENDNNRSVLEKLNRLINKSNIGVHSVVLGTDSRSALEITSNTTGFGFSPEQFTFKNSSTHPGDVTVYDLGIDNISSYPQNAIFYLNGTEKTSANNTFTVNNKFEVTLKNTTTDGTKTTVSLKDNVDSVLKSVNDFVSTYNNMVELAISKSEGNGDSSRLFSELKRYANAYVSDLNSIGLTFEDDGKLAFDDSILIQAADNGTVDESMAKLNNFKNGLVTKSNDITINPMKYVDKTMISYPNPIRTYANPYVTSIYSGMMYNGYI